MVRRSDRHRARARAIEAEEDSVDAATAPQEPVRIRSWFDEGDPAEPSDEAAPVFRPWTLAPETASTGGLDGPELDELPRRSDRHPGTGRGSRPDVPHTAPSAPVGDADSSTFVPRTRAEARAAARREASAHGARRRRALVAALVLLVVVATTWWVMRPAQPVPADTTAQHSAHGLVVDRPATTPLTS